MVFRSFNRKIFAAVESTGGTAETINTATDFIEAIDPTYTITPLMFPGTSKTNSLTQMVQTVPGASASAPVSTVEISFGVEMAGPTDNVAAGNVPAFGFLLKACGMVEQTAVKAYTLDGTPAWSGQPFFNNEGVEGASGAFSSADCTSWSDNTVGDSEFWSLTGGLLGNVRMIGQVSGATVQAAALTAATQIGVGYSFNTASSDDNLANSSATIRIYTGGAQYVQGRGMRGTAEIAFVHGDRAIIQFTFTGVLDNVTESADPTNYIYSALNPPAWISTGMAVQNSTSSTANWTSSLFTAMTLSLGNEVTVREDTNSADGYVSGMITSRAPTLTWNPDAVLKTSTLDFWGDFLAGTPIRMRWSLGTTAKNTVDFRVSAAQFTGVTRGEREAVEVLDTTTSLTGGTYGSSVPSAGTTRSNTVKGSDNELFILFR